MAGGTAIEVRDLRKSYRVPETGSRSLRSRLLRPVERGRGRLEVLKGISFDVRQGEMFALLGRNGCGKSSLLRMIASIYRPDSGSIRVAGRIAPLIELGVGFESELSARQNILLNGVMLGMSPAELRQQQDAILDFAELEDFANMPIKNYSSGMQLRLAFAIVIQTRPDILLVDEIYAVGDAGFQQKCTEALLELKGAGKTVVVVSHDMEIVQRYCDRAMLIERGEIESIGDPREVVRRYFELTLEHRPAEVNDFLIEGIGGDLPEPRARIRNLWIRGSNGKEATIPQGEPIRVEGAVEVHRPMRPAGLRLEIRTEHGARVFSPEDSAMEEARVYAAGERLRTQVAIENRLSPGRYRLNCVVLHADGGEPAPASSNRSLAFEVAGSSHPGAGLVRLGHRVRFSEEISAQ